MNAPNVFIEFHKMHHLQNDFVIIEEDTLKEQKINKEFIKLICNRRAGIGCDQLIIVRNQSSASQISASIKIYNGDGSEAEMCGNAILCVSNLYFDKYKDSNSIQITTVNKTVTTYRDNGQISINMGIPSLDFQDVGINIKSSELLDKFINYNITNTLPLSVGNPHIVMLCKEPVDSMDIELLGKPISQDAIFNKGINVEFINILNPNQVRMRVYERGAGVTMACGSGACAAFYAAYKMGLISDSAEIILDGGLLSVEIKNKEIFLRGVPSYSFSGIY